METPQTQALCEHQRRDTQADLTHLVTLMTRERYTNDPDFRLRRCMASARYYVKKRLMAGKDVKSKYEPPADIFLADNKAPPCHESVKT
jgi:hypothetical protein